MTNRAKSNKNRQVNPNSLANLKKGGPGRKPEPPEIKKMFVEASIEAAQMLINTMHNEDAKLELRIDCANEILNRGIGKPIQQVISENINENTNRNYDFSNLTVAEIKELLRNGN